MLRRRFSRVFHYFFKMNLFIISDTEIELNENMLNYIHKLEFLIGKSFDQLKSEHEKFKDFLYWYNKIHNLLLFSLIFLYFLFVSLYFIFFSLIFAYFLFNFSLIFYQHSQKLRFGTRTFNQRVGNLRFFQEIFNI